MVTRRAAGGSGSGAAARVQQHCSSQPGRERNGTAERGLGIPSDCDAGRVVACRGGAPTFSSRLGVTIWPTSPVTSGWAKNSHVEVGPKKYFGPR